jgi:tripartite-type tricarboxylate transporter receptor subunit TctC
MKKFWMIGFLLAGFYAGWAMISPVAAQEKFPSKPINLTVGFEAGGVGDSICRYLANFATKKLGQPMVVFNNPGGSGVVASTALKNLPADGYNIGWYSSSAVINVNMMRKPPYNPVKDFEPILQVGANTAGLVVQAESPYKTLDDLIAYARANPGKMTYSSSGPGTPQHLTMIQLGEAAKANWVHIPSKGGLAACTMLLGGHVTAVSTGGEWTPFVDAGRLRLLAIYLSKRSDKYPNVPTLSELGYKIGMPSFLGIAGPRGIPKDRVKILYETLYEGMQTPGFKDLAMRLSTQVSPNGPEVYGNLIEEVYETSKVMIDKMVQEGKLKR